MPEGRGRLSDSAGAPQGRQGTIERLRALGLKARKSLGQHFLHDPRILGAIVEECGVSSADRVFEVGTGPGTLTREIAVRARQVLTVEVDTDMLAFARQELSSFSNISFLNSDVLQDRERLHPRVLEALRALEPFHWVSNLPYGLATTLTVTFCESGLHWGRAALTVQSEVAERLAAAPGDPAYGAVSALVQFWAKVGLGRHILPGSFWPPPKVHSRVLLLERAAPLGTSGEYPAYRTWVKRLFQHPRKQVGTILRKTLGGAETLRLSSKLPFPLDLRPGNLGPDNLLALSRALG